MEEIRNIVRGLNESGFSNSELRSLVNALSYECNWDLAKVLIEKEIYRHELYYKPLLEKINGMDDEYKEKVNQIAKFMINYNKAKLDEIMPIQ